MPRITTWREVFFSLMATLAGPFCFARDLYGRITEYIPAIRHRRDMDDQLRWDRIQRMMTNMQTDLDSKRFPPVC